MSIRLLGNSLSVEEDGREGWTHGILGSDLCRYGNNWDFRFKTFLQKELEL